MWFWFALGCVLILVGLVCQYRHMRSVKAARAENCRIGSHELAVVFKLGELQSLIACRHCNRRWIEDRALRLTIAEEELSHV